MQGNRKPCIIWAAWHAVRAQYFDLDCASAPVESWFITKPPSKLLPNPEGKSVY